jgi:hypothetical protein
MNTETILRWYAGMGWIVLSGGADAGGEIRAAALRRAKASGGVAYIGFNEDSADAILDDMDDLGAPTGYLVNVVTEDDDTIRQQIEEASVIVLDDSVTPDEWRSSLLGTAIEAIQSALSRGAVLLAEGSGAEALGGFTINDHGQLTQGLGCIANTLILTDTTSLADSEVARAILDAQPDALVLGIGVGSAVALGGDGSLEVLGEEEVAIALGRDYQ